MRTKSWLLGLLIVMVGSVTSNAQSASEIKGIKAANQSFYTALSAMDPKAMDAVWAKTSYAVSIGPFNKKIDIGYEAAISKYFTATFNHFSKMSVSVSTAEVRTSGGLGYVIGVEQGEVQPKSGKGPIKIKNFVTNIFEKDHGRWLMVSHHASSVPK